MILRISVLVSCSILVSTHSGAPAISAQTYPIYQQNGFANPSPSQPHEIAPYYQAYTTQNQSPQPNLYPSIIRQVLLNKFLSNSPTQTNLDPNLRSYGLNFDGYQNNQIAPNLLNKYLAPAQYLNTNDVNKEEIVEKKTKETSKRKRKRSKKKKHHESKDETDGRRSKDSQQTDITLESLSNTRRKSRKHKTRNSDQENELKVKEKSNIRKTRKRKRNGDKQTESQLKEEENKVENTKIKKRRRHKKPKPDVDNTGKDPVEENVTLKEMKESFNLAQSSGKEENRVIRNPQIESNGTKPIAKTPDDVASTFLSKLPTFDNPIMSNFMTNYENFYQSLLNNMTVTENKPQNIEIRKPKRNRTNNNRRRINYNNKNATQEITKTKPKLVKVKIDTVTTEKTVQVTDKIQTVIDFNKNYEVKKSIEETKVDEGSMTELPKEDFGNTRDLDENVNDPYNGYVDDYYPQFTDSAYNANNKENYIKILGDDKYFYATDEEIKRLNIENGLPERKIKEYELNKQYDDIEETLLKIDDEDNEIEFKTPPLLEKPDFETRPITISNIRPEVYYKKDDNHDGTHRFVGDKSIEIKPQQKPNFKPSKDLETVYARSKVVKYGSVHSSEERNTKSDWSETFQDGGTTYVIAKSLDYPEYW